MDVFYQIFMNSSLGYVLRVVPFTALVGLSYWGARGLLLRRRGLRRGPLSVEIPRLLLACYLGGLLSLVWTPPNFWSELWFRILNGYPSGEMGWTVTLDFNLTPSLFLYLRGELTGGSWTQFMAVGNILMYLPLGILLPWAWEKGTFPRVLAAGTALSLITELGQPFLGRSFDLDDLAANILGILLGLALFLPARRFLRGRRA